MRVLVTGATGFVGQALIPALIVAGHEVTAVVRNMPVPSLVKGITVHTIADIGPDTDWAEALKGIDAVAHLAGRAHVMSEDTADAEEKYNRINACGTERLACSAADIGVKRFILMSTVKVMGEKTQGVPFSELDIPAPEDAYGASKLAGEQALRRIAGESSLEDVILRPPLLYGPGAKGNFRSLLFIGNLVDAVISCLENPNAARQTFFVRDGEDLSTSELIRRVGRALNKPPHLFPSPPALLLLAGRVTGRSQTVERLLCSLQVNDKKIRYQLGWTPPYNVVQGLDAMAAWFLARKFY
jgi:nucleoside-diphosphate-sugar epimerase